MVKGKKAAAAPPAPVATDEEGATRVGPLHEAHAAYLLRTHDVTVDPEHIFLVYSTRTAFRGRKAAGQDPSPEYLGVSETKSAQKEEIAAAKAEAKEKRDKERADAKAVKEKAKAEKAEAAAVEKAAKEAAAATEKAKADKAAAATPAAKKAAAKKTAAPAKGKGKAKSGSPF